ncbi:hypothetical protein DENSPDRAFT_883920 [Dentipellis sp. KUC8613]|nr:hypothetical protein DENSPDRAFT_883920 [Dentipellis sp. KUC8613]
MSLPPPNLISTSQTTTTTTPSRPAAALPQPTPQMGATPVRRRRPLPAAGNRLLPHDPTVATSGSPDVAIADAAPSSFKKQMNPTFTEQKRQEIQLQEAKRKRDEAIKMTERKTKEVVMVYAWTKNDAPPDLHQFHNSTHPHFSLSAAQLKDLGFTDPPTMIYDKRSGRALNKRSCGTFRAERAAGVKVSSGQLVSKVIDCISPSTPSLRGLPASNMLEPESTTDLGG